MPIVPLLGVLFIGLKLSHVITWPWISVLAPFWIAFVVGLWWSACVILLAARASSRRSTGLFRPRQRRARSL